MYRLSADNWVGPRSKTNRLKTHLHHHVALPCTFLSLSPLSLLSLSSLFPLYLSHLAYRFGLYLMRSSFSPRWTSITPPLSPISSSSSFLSLSLTLSHFHSLHFLSPQEWLELKLERSLRRQRQLSCLQKSWETALGESVSLRERVCERVCEEKREREKVMVRNRE